MDVLLLPLLGAATKQNHQSFTIFAKIHTVSGAKVDPALEYAGKDLPIVRVMDDGNRPKKKVSPIRSLIVGLSVLLALLLASVWVLAKHSWEQLSPHDSRRVLVSEAAAEFRALVGKIGRRN